MVCLPSIAHDVRNAWRSLRRRPAFTGTAVVLLAAGIAIGTTSFALVHAVAFRPLQQPGAERLVTPVTTDPARNVTAGLVSYPQFLEWRGAEGLFERLSLVQWIEFDLTMGDHAERVGGAWVSDEYFRVLAARPECGRLIDGADFSPQAPRVAVLGDRLWRRLFAADRGVVGRTIALDGARYTIIGVVRTATVWPSQLDVWVPLKIAPAMMQQLQRFDAAVFESLGRLRPGVTLQQARKRVVAIAARQAREHPEVSATSSATVVSLRDRIVPPAWRTTFVMLLGAVTFVVLLCCANVANLLVSVAVDRRRDVAIRLALGGTRAGAVRESVVESVVLVVLSTAAGLLLATWLVPLGSALAAVRLSGLAAATIGWETIAFTGVMATIAAAMLASVSAVTVLKGAPADMLQPASRDLSATGGRRVRLLLVGIEVALSIVLLTGAGLMVRSLERLRRVDPGFTAENVLTLRLRTPPGRRPPAEAIAFADRLTADLRSMPNIVSASLASSLPAGAGGLYFERPLVSSDLPNPPASHDAQVHWTVVTPGYFDTLGLRLLCGRRFDERDGDSTPRVVIVNEALASELFPGRRSPVGERVRAWRDENVPLEIVGVVNNVRCLQWVDDFRPIAYVPQRQSRVATNMLAVRLRPGAPWTAAFENIRRRVTALDPRLAVLDAGPMSRVAGDQMADSRTARVALLVFASFGLLLACAGIYAVTSCSVAGRRREFGVRMALGARPPQVVRLVTLQTLGPVALGIAGGVAAAFGLARVLRSLLFEVRPTDPVTFVTVPLLFAIVALAACAIPARHAAHVDPATTLRGE